MNLRARGFIQYSVTVLEANADALAALAKTETDFWWSRGMRRILFRLLDPLVAGRSIRRALEAGFGTGTTAQVLRDRYEWDVCPLAVGWEGSPGVRDLVQCEIEALPFRRDAFEAVLVLDVLAHVREGKEDAPLAEFMRVLAPGGLLVVRAPALRVFRSRHSQFTGEVHRYTRSALIELVERHGVRVMRSSYMNALLAPGAFVKFRFWEPLLRKPPASGVVRRARVIDNMLSASLALESFWLGSGLNLPVGQSVLLIGEKPAR